MLGQGVGFKIREGNTGKASSPTPDARGAFILQMFSVGRAVAITKHSYSILLWAQSSDAVCFYDVNINE